MKNPRQITVEALMKVESRGAWSNLALDAHLVKYGLDSRDAAFVAMLFYGTLERLVTLDACIAAHSRQAPDKLSPAVLWSLRTGVYQLLYMDAVPDSAAVNESVELVKRLRKAQASGYVNGVLRAFLRAHKAVPVPAEPAAAALSVEYACPRPLVELLLSSYGEEAARRFLQDSLGRPPMYLRVNTRLISAEELISRLAAHGVEARPDPELDHCLAVEKTGAVHRLPEYRRGFYHVQDKASQLCALALEALPGMRVLDACSAPGGKAFTLMELMNNQGELVAADLHPHRAKLVADRAKEMKLSGIRAATADMTVYDKVLGAFDRVLCDVPCSGLGVIRRKPEIKHTPLGEFDKLPSVQYKILETTAHYCKQGGRLLYSTCTLNPAENEAVADRFLREHPEFSPASLPAALVATTGGHRRTLMGELGADGFFLAAFTRAC